MWTRPRNRGMVSPDQQAPLLKGLELVKRETCGLVDSLLLCHTGEHLAGELGFGVQADGQALAGVLLADVGVGQ